MGKFLISIHNGRRTETSLGFQELDHAGTIKDQTLEEAVLEPIDATNRDELRSELRSSNKRWRTDEQVQYKNMIKSSGLRTVVYDPAVDGADFKQWFGARDHTYMTSGTFMDFWIPPSLFRPHLL